MNKLIITGPSLNAHRCTSAELSVVSVWGLQYHTHFTKVKPVLQPRSDPPVDTPPVCTLTHTHTLSLHVNKSFGCREGKRVHVPSVGPRGRVFHLLPLLTSIPGRWSLIYSSIRVKYESYFSIKVVYQQQYKSVAVTFLYFCDPIHSECVYSSHVSIQVRRTEREINVME